MKKIMARIRRGLSEELNPHVIRHCNQWTSLHAYKACQNTETRSFQYLIGTLQELSDA